MSPMARQSASMVQGADAPEMGLELGERHFDGIEERAVRRQEQAPGAALLEDGLGLCALAAGEVVEDHHVARLQCWGELGFDVGVEDLAVQALIDDPRRGQAIASQPGDEGLDGPVSERRIGPLNRAPRSNSATQTGHLGRRAGFVEEDQPMDLPRACAAGGTRASTSRACRTSSRPASEARSVFFERQARLQQHPRQRRRMRCDILLGFQFGRQFRHRDVRLGLDPLEQRRQMRRQLAAARRDGPAAPAPPIPSAIPDPPASPQSLR